MKKESQRFGSRPAILFVQYTNPDFYPTSYNLARMLAAQGYDVVICCRADRPANIADYGEHVSVHRIGTPRNGLLAPVEFAFFLLACFFTARRRKPCLIVGYDLHGLIAAALIAQLFRIPFFYHLYDLFLPEEGIGKFDCFLKRYEACLSSRALALIMPSESKAEYFLKAVGLNKSVFVVANSPPLQTRTHSSLLHKRLAERGFKASYVVYYHGSIGSGKGLLPVIRSIPYWPETAVFVMLGVIYEREFFSELMRVATELVIQNRVHYLGVVPFPELYDCTRSADIGLFLPESFASIHLHSGAAVVKLNDYMACGVPFLVSKMPALSALARETGAGIDCSIDDPCQLGQTIGELLLDCARREEMGDRGYRCHRDKFNLATQYEPVLSVIRHICPVDPGATA